MSTEAGRDKSKASAIEQGALLSDYYWSVIDFEWPTAATTTLYMDILPASVLIVLIFMGEISRDVTLVRLSSPHTPFKKLTIEQTSKQTHHASQYNKRTAKEQ